MFPQLVTSVSLAVLRFVDALNIHALTAKVCDSSGKPEASIILQSV
jgi:hypothetical protein